MERQIVVSRKSQLKEKKTMEYLPSKQSSDEEKSCLTEEEDNYLSDASHNSKKRRREATTCDRKKIKKHTPSKESSYKTCFDDWLFGSNQQKNVTNRKVAIKTDDEDMMMMNLMQRSSGDSCFPRAQFLAQVGTFVLPYTVPF